MFALKYIGAEETAQFVKCLPCRHEILNSITRIYIVNFKSQLSWQRLVIPALEKQRQVDPRAHWATSPTIMVSTQGQLRDPVLKNKQG